MKHLRFVFALVVFLIPVAVFAQDDVPTSDLTAALEMFRAEYGEDALVLNAEFEEERNGSCWEFNAILADSMAIEVEICIDADTGELAMDSEEEEMDDNDDEAMSMSVPTLSIDEAIVIASEAYTDSEIVEVEFEDGEGALTWDLEFADGSQVVIDSETGDVLEVGLEAEDNDDDDQDDDDENGDDDNEDGDDNDKTTRSSS